MIISCAAIQPIGAEASKYIVRIILSVNRVISFTAYQIINVVTSLDDVIAAIAIDKVTAGASLNRINALTTNHNIRVFAPADRIGTVAGERRKNRDDRINKCQDVRREVECCTYPKTIPE